MFYLKLAWNNIKSSKKAYAPFLLASFVLYSLTCSILLIMTSPMREGMDTAAIILPLGVVVLTILSIAMEIYSYNILLKQRSKEFGLYNILGMNKRQVGWVSTLELGIIFIFLVILGSIFSGIFANFLYLIFVNIINYDKLILTLSPLAFILNASLFVGIFFILMLVGLRRIGKTSPLSLFKSSEQGEKEPRGNMFLAFLSVLFIGSGYGISLYSKDLAALLVILYFFVAVVLVILGTYLFYISFMAWYLKKKRSNKAYFYQPKHFITTSQMIFRMKANAAGLASITLLSVMAFVSIGTTAALYANTQTQISKLFINDAKISLTVDGFSDEGQALLDKYVLSKLDSQKKVVGYTSSLISFPLENRDHISYVNIEEIKQAAAETGFIFVVTQDDFKKLGNDVPNLSANQVAFFKQQGNSHYKTINLLGNQFNVVKNYQTAIIPEVYNTYNGAVMIVTNEEVATKLKTSFKEIMDYAVTFPPNTYTAHLNLTKEEAEKLNLASGVGIVDDAGNGIGDIQFKQDVLDEGYTLFGGMLFTGVVLGLSFLLGAALIIYYKQYSEGQEDKKSYKILQEVGMSKEEVKKTISSQTILVFFMPLGIAALHYVVAIPMLKQMLLFFGVASSNLVYLVAGITMLVVGILYFISYKVTSRTYYKLVER
ncbi:MULTISPECIES: FtsX-like permease family protein [Streptococcus]|uniref:FtsX-like permease family protein n=1 Tax=Streptococcus caledonicus TaxID=2614158 RepID=A0ABW0UFD0_9STRE|nr:ABC transporter permease [Streptococcus sp. S784/96/1]